MKQDLTILDSLTPQQKKEFENDLQVIYKQCYDKTKGDLKVMKDVIVNMNLQNEVFLNVILEFDSTIGNEGKGRITHLSKYPNKLTYDAAVNSERNIN